MRSNQCRAPKKHSHVTVSSSQWDWIPINEFYQKALELNIPAFATGDAEEIAEASAAIFSGRIKGSEIARFLGQATAPIPEQWYASMEILKSKPGKLHPTNAETNTANVFPVFHCNQEIPCDPCASLCPKGLITLQADDIRAIPHFNPELGNCIHCEKCVAGCPGLAITLVDPPFRSPKPVRFLAA